MASPHVFFIYCFVFLLQSLAHARDTTKDRKASHAIQAKRAPESVYLDSDIISESAKALYLGHSLSGEIPILGKIACFTPGPRVTRTTFNECRAVLRSVSSFVPGPKYREVQRFKWHSLPRSPRPPPYRFNDPHGNCELNITVADTRIVSEFSFEQAKQAAQEVLQECEDHGHYNGGWSPMTYGLEHGWRVEIGGVPEWRRRREPMDSTTAREDGGVVLVERGKAAAAVDIAKRMPPRENVTVLRPTFRPGRVMCHHPQPFISRTTFVQCQPAFRSMTRQIKGQAFRAVQRFAWNYLPRFPHPPPYEFHEPGHNCVLNITLEDEKIAGEFSFEQAKLLAQDVMQECQDLVRGAPTYGGWAAIAEGAPRGWRVEIGGLAGGEMLIAQPVAERDVSSIGNIERSEAQPSQNFSGMVASSGSSISLGLDPGPVECHAPSTKLGPVTIQDCNPAFEVPLEVLSLEDYHLVRRFVWDRLPVEPHKPPYSFKVPGYNCIFDITTEDTKQIARFSFAQASYLARLVLKNCFGKGFHYGGYATMVQSVETGWRVEVKGQSLRTVEGDVVERSTTSEKEAERRLEKQGNLVPRALAPLINVTADAATSFLAHGRVMCYGTERAHTSFSECRQTFRSMIAVMTSYEYRRVQRFYWHQLPNFAHCPPYKFYVIGINCELNITTEDRSTLGTFSFEQAKMLGQQIMDECEERGRRFGGYASLMAEEGRGWRVEVGARTGHDHPGADMTGVIDGDMKETTGGSLIDREVSRSTYPNNVANCYSAGPAISRTSFRECQPVFRSLQRQFTSPEYRLKHRFVWHRSPRFPSTPPYHFTVPGYNCQLNITARSPATIGEFSFEQAKLLAQEVLQDCLDEGRFYGGWGPLDPNKAIGWRVEITGLPEQNSIDGEQEVWSQVDERADLPPPPPLLPPSLVANTSNPPASALAANRIQCYSARTHSHPTTFSECRKVFRVVRDALSAKEWYEKQKFVWGQKPDYPLHPPPWIWEFRDCGCIYSITAQIRHTIAEFSFSQATQLAQEVLDECEGRKLFFGGSAPILSDEDGWRVEIRGKSVADGSNSDPLQPVAPDTSLTQRGAVAAPAPPAPPAPLPSSLSL